MNFYDSWYYLQNHYMFKDDFIGCLDIEVQKVNPITCAVDEDKSKNTKIEIWLECGPYLKDCKAHDVDLDCGGDTFENAIINLAKLVKDKYGDDKDIIEQIINEQYGNNLIE